MSSAGLLGLGTIGRVHLEAYEKLKAENSGINLEACFDISQDNLTCADAVRRYTDLDSFFEAEKGRLDFVDICLPTFMHREIAEKAMKFGFNVLCEKPMALNSSDAQAMYEMSETTGRHLMIAHVLRFNKHFNAIKNYIENKTFGKIKSVKCTTNIKGLPNGQNSWFQNKALSGGPVLDVHVHDADLFVWLFGVPVSLSAVGNENSFSSNLVYDDFYANIQCDFSAIQRNGLGRTMHIDFENGYLHIDGSTFVASGSDGTEKDLTCEYGEIVDSYSDPMYYNEIKYFARAVEADSFVQVCPPQQSMFSVKLIESEIDSALCGGKIIKF